MITFRFCRTAFSVAVLVALCISTTFAAKDEASPEEPLLLRAYTIPAGTFTAPDPSSKTGARKPAQGIRPISPSDPRPDVKAFLMRLGVPFPPGSEASYQADGDIYRPCLVVRQTQKNLDALDTLLGSMCDGVPTQLEVEISAYRFPPAGTHSLPEDGKWNPDAIQRLEKSAFPCLSGWHPNH